MLMTYVPSSLYGLCILYGIKTWAITISLDDGNNTIDISSEVDFRSLYLLFEDLWKRDLVLRMKKFPFEDVSIGSEVKWRLNKHWNLTRTGASNVYPKATKAKYVGMSSVWKQRISEIWRDIFTCYKDR